MALHSKHSKVGRERKSDDNPTYPTIITPPKPFGDGKGSAVVLKGNPSTLRADLYVHDLDLYDRLYTNGYRVVVSGSLTVHEGGLIDNSGRDGNNPRNPGKAGGVGTLGRVPSYVSGTFNQDGGIPDGNGGNTYYVAVSQTVGGYNGGHSNSNAASGEPQDYYNEASPPFLTYGDIFNASDGETQFTGGAGGSGSPTSYGGGGAGVVVVIARNIVINTFQSTVIRASGGNGTFSSGGGGGGLVVVLFEKTSSPKDKCGSSLGLRPDLIDVTGGNSGGTGAQQGGRGTFYVRQRKKCC